jgi:bifunctional UDP-N-acetylglucosamine pyrophosphorylase/glucosamine-1-phosphate N-acetyltransferase
MGLSLVVLAAGEGKRLRSSVPKPLHEAAGRPLLWHVLAAASRMPAAATTTPDAPVTGRTVDHPIDRTVVVVGRGADDVRAALDDFGLPSLGEVTTALQAELRGTGDAVACAVPALPPDGDTLVLYGDCPLLRPETLAALVAAHRAGGAAITLLTARAADPTGLGRILRDEAGAVTGIVEERDATGEQRAITEVNAGVYVISREALELLPKLSPDNQQGEWYLTDLVGHALAAGGTVASAECDEVEALGVNDRAQLAQVSAELRRRTCETLMAAGVTLVDPATTYVDADVTVGTDTVLLPLTFLERGTRVGAGCTIGPNARLVGCTVADGAAVTQAVAVGAQVGEHATVGPFAYLRPGAVLGPRAKVGTYVEVKASTIGEGSKVPHLTYVGDATIGENVNVGAGTVFVNYDGASKHSTAVGDGAFIGSATMLIAPVDVGAGAQTAAGSVINHDVPPDALAIERAEQRTIEGWAERRRQKQADHGH